MEDKKKPLVSVVVPVYNAEKTIVRCVESIEEQTYKNIEVILVNDGSVDNSISKCIELKKRYKNIVLIDKENEGTSKTRNCGIINSTGKYLSFVDSDDACDKMMIECFVEYMEKYNVDIVISGIRKKYLYKKGKKSIDVLPLIEGVFEKNDFLDIFIKLENQNLIASSCNKMYKKDVLLKHNIFFEENVTMGEDYRFNLKCIDNMSAFAVLNMPFYIYYIGNKSISTGYRKNEFEERLANVGLYEQMVVEYNMNNEYIAISYLRMAFSTIMNIHNPQNKDKISQKRLDINSIIKNEKVLRSIKKCSSKGIINNTIKILFKLNSINLLYLVTWLASKTIEKR